MTKKKTTKKTTTDPIKCPACGRDNEYNTVVKPGGPSPGDLAICFGCHAVLIFDNNGRQREVSGDERSALLEDPRVRAALKCLARGGGWEDVERAVEKAQTSS